MTERPVDRGVPFRGLLTTQRDHRQSPDTFRKIENFRLPDSYPRRRPGFGFFGDDETRIQGQQLTKQTPTAQMGIRVNEDIGVTEFEEHEKYPNGYGLIRWHDDFQPKSTRDWTVEVQLTLGEKERLVDDPEDRQTRFTYNAARRSVRHVAGVFVYDQTVLASYCDFHDTVGISNLRPPTIVGVPTFTNIQSTDTLALSALAIGYNDTEIFATCTLIDTPGNDYYPYKVKLTHGITYVEGADYHVAVRYTNSSRLLELIIEGGAASGGSGSSTYSLLAAERFAGEIDAINNQTQVIQRDIVLLNECTVRGAYASTCKLSHIANGCTKFTQYKLAKTGPSSTILGPAVVTHCTPPRGTGLSELRIWHEARDNSELSSNDKLEIASPYPANLKGYWRLNDGGGILIEKVGEKHGSLHNTYPQFVANKNLLHNQGLNFADNQYIQGVLGPDVYAEDSYAMMRRCMEGKDPSSINIGKVQYESVCDWTFQIQITMPYTEQQELDTLNISGLNDTSRWDSAGEIREVPSDGSVSPNDDYRCHTYEVLDGQETPVPLLNDRGEENQGGTDNMSMFHPAYDMTLFCVEAPEKQADTDTDNHADLRRIPLVRGMITPDREPVLEFYSDGNGSTADGPRTDYPLGTQVGRYLRIKGNPIALGATKTITFRKKSLFESIVSPILPIGFKLEIWVDGILDKSKNYVFNTAATLAHTDTHGFHRACAHRPVYNINVGASHVNDFEDKSETAPIDDNFGVTMPARHGMLRNRNRQDHPGFFQMGFFRCWATVALSDEDIRQTWDKSIAQEKSADPNLIINLEIDHTAPQILNKTRYVLPFSLNYKSWHVHNGDHSLSAGRLQYEEYTWENEDCPGYNRLPSDYTPTESQQARCNLLGLYNAVLARTFGLFSIFGDAPFFDDDLSGDRQDVYVPVVGLLSEWAPGQKWESSTVADRMVLTATGALPKIFDGKSIYTMGFTMYRGPHPQLSTDVTGGSLSDAKFFGLVIAYFSEKNSILDVSPRTVIKTEERFVVESGAIAAGGAGYTIGDTLTVVGGTGTAATFNVDSVAAGVVDGISLVSAGFYSVSPTNPVATTVAPIGGAGCTINLTMVNAHTNEINLNDIIAHPDPRVTSYRIYRTVEQDTRALAEVATLFLIDDGAFENKYTIELAVGDVDSTLLDVVLDQLVTRPPFGSISGALDGVLWIGGDPLTGDAIYPSDPGNPQRFDIVSGQRVIEEDSGEFVNALLPLFGDLYVCKPTSIHRLTPVGNNQYQIIKIVGVGPVSARAIEIVVLPDTGRTVFVFWSKFGPYIFDGARDQYIGEAIEIDREGGESFDWLDADSVFVLHDPANREIQFRYKSVSGGTTADRHDKAIVFNYRLNAWYTYGQTVGDYALFANIANDGTIAAIGAQTPTTSPVPLTPTAANKLIVGGPNGHLYEWGSTDRDGETTEVSINPTAVVSWSSPTITVTASTFSASDKVRGNWITVVKADGSDWFSSPATTNSTNTITLDLDYAAVKFAPASGDSVYIGQPMAELQMPWDILDRPYYEKEIAHFAMWYSKEFWYRIAKDWDTAEITVWKQLTDSGGQRRHELPLTSGESLKFYFRSVELSARLDGFFFIVSDRAGSGIQQI